MLEFFGYYLLIVSIVALVLGELIRRLLDK